MARTHVGLEQHEVVARIACAQLRDPLGRFPVGDARIGEPRKREDVRVVFASTLS